MEIKKLLKEGTAYLAYHGIPFYEREAAYILMDLLGFATRAQLFEISWVSESMLLEYRKRLQKRGQRCPTAYVHGSICFFGLKLHVDARVLIPRVETELLIEHIVTYVSFHPEIHTFYDVCCGSGCLGLAIKKSCPHLEVVLSDICSQAVSVAKENAVNNHLDVEILLGDLFDPYVSPGDAFVCNPPYLSYREIIQSDPEVRCYEPWQALVGGSTGLEFYERIAQELPKVLALQGVGWLEIGYNQGREVQNIFSKQGISGNVYQDLAGWDRIFFLEIDQRDPVSSRVYS
ncbi:peptide chain release factor N(5)-glutamine methyltransferase [Candidatus Chlamydia sanziniae]|uniref:peptide chain release factor N(5)-glutamine methyltransferase n=1 Tax=Candidatus Chlamydia sanziniae TaxID=1806891 RepID=A0A1A9HV83_9CHLA|nr:peptide chain release factor N(5)-glutamine methyltransferase [Candidatus Chlamydia sanziniae]ANH78899.1 Protein-N(5)-glutamine methyltransferase PrmC [Candidatus Chlamydia sanziniae]